METKSCHSNQSSYPFGTHLFVAPTIDAICEIWKRISFTASEKKSFANVDGRTTDDGRRIPAYGSGEQIRNSGLCNIANSLVSPYNQTIGH